MFFPDYFLLFFPYIFSSVARGNDTPCGNAYTGRTWTLTCSWVIQVESLKSSAVIPAGIHSEIPAAHCLGWVTGMKSTFNLYDSNDAMKCIAAASEAGGQLSRKWALGQRQNLKNSVRGRRGGNFIRQLYMSLLIKLKCNYTVHESLHQFQALDYNGICSMD